MDRQFAVINSHMLPHAFGTNLNGQNALSKNFTHPQHLTEYVNEKIICCIGLFMRCLTIVTQVPTYVAQSSRLCHKGANWK